MGPSSSGTASYRRAGYWQDGPMGRGSAPCSRPGGPRAGGPAWRGRGGALVRRALRLSCGCRYRRCERPAAPQQRALETVLVRAEPEDRPPERFAISAGFLSVLLSLGASEPLLVAVDDLQWLDAATAEVLGFAAGRAGGRPFRFLLSRRSGSGTGVEHELGSAGLRRVEVGPLNLGATRQLLLHDLGLTLPAWTLSRLFEATQGNPLLALEPGRALAGGRTWPVGAELPVADLVANPFGARVARLSVPSRRALLAAALSGHVSLPQLMAVADAAAVEELVADGLLISDGEQVRLSHPLLAVAARRQAKVPERRTLHLALAKVAGDETLRARHLALSARAQDAGPRRHGRRGSRGCGTAGRRP